jgi:hypothetical protein
MTENAIQQDAQEGIGAFLEMRYQDGLGCATRTVVAFVDMQG